MIELLLFVIIPLAPASSTATRSRLPSSSAVESPPLWPHTGATEV
jgi:hypothetical protein